MKNEGDNIPYDICCTCLKSNDHLINTLETDSNNVQLTVKLKFCVPEVEWTEGFICELCLNLLNQAYRFKEQCLQSNKTLAQEYSSQDGTETGKVDKIEEPEDEEAHFSENNSISDIFLDSSEEKEKPQKQVYWRSSNITKFNISMVPTPESYVCKTCGRQFEERKLLAEHNRDFHDQKRPYNCMYCEKLFKSRAHVNRHELIHLNQRSYTCEICYQSYNTSSILSKHKIIKHTDPREWKYICPHCDRKYPFKSNRDAHIRRHHTNAGDTYTCYHCSESYSNKLLLISHIRSKHSSVNALKRITKECNICKKVYINQVILENHLRKKHNLGNTILTKRIKQYNCSKCGKKYTTEKMLKMHFPVCDGIKRHSSIRKFRLTKLKSQEHPQHFDKEESKGVNGSSEQIFVPGEIKEENLNGSSEEIFVPIEIKEENLKENHSPEQLQSKSNKQLQQNTINKEKEEKKQKWINLTCEICNFVIGPYKKLVSHAITEHGADPKTLKPYHCDECDAKFSSSTHLARHKTYHAGNRVHICSFCGKGFITKKDMVTHEKLHSNVRDIQCEICSKNFNTKTHLRTHKLVVHTDPSQWNHTCPYCGKRFPMKSNYDQHVRRHTGEKPFSCHLCEKRFSDKFVLQQHFQTHSNIKAFKCSYCDKEYKNNRVLEVHLTKVHGIGNAKIPVRVKKFFCDCCPKSFAAKDKLKRHMCSHTGERPYSCNICEKKFTDKSYVKQHLKTVHNVFENKYE